MSIDLTQAQADTEAYLMPQTYTITRVAKVSDNGGGFTAGTETTVTGICALSENSGALQQGGDALKEQGKYTMIVPLNADIVQTDQPVVSGRQFRIVYTPPASAFALSRILGLDEVRH